MKTVLCVEAEAGKLATLKQSLEQAGYCALTASSAWQALELLAGHRVDGVVLDLNMPDLDGIALRGRIQRVNRSLPVLLLSGSAEASSSALACFEQFMSEPEHALELLAHMGETHN